jgi:cysteine desulfurase
MIDTDKLIELIDENTVLVSVMYANNEIGTIEPLRDVAEIVRQKRAERGYPNGKPLYLHTDACQASAYLGLHVSRLGVDLMTINASKIYGPKQVGALYVRAGVTLAPVISGGGQERNLRSGTENVAGIIGFATALELVQSRRIEEVNRLQQLQKTFRHLIAEKLSNVIVNGSQKHSLPNNVHITIPGADNERIMMQLDELGILVAVGSACSASSEEPSHVLRAIGMSDEDARSSLRITMGHSTSEDDIRRTVDTLRSILA